MLLYKVLGYTAHGKTFRSHIKTKLKCQDNFEYALKKHKKNSDNPS